MKRKSKLYWLVFSILTISLILLGCNNVLKTGNYKSETKQQISFGATVGNLTTEDEVVTPADLTKELAKFTPKKEEYKYAMFHIPMFTSKNIIGSRSGFYDIDGSYIEFYDSDNNYLEIYAANNYNKAFHIELKATTNNFGNADWYSGENTTKRDVLYVAHTQLNDSTLDYEPDNELYIDTCQIFIKGYSKDYAYYFNSIDGDETVVYDGRGYVKISSTQNTYEGEEHYVPEYLTIIVSVENFRRNQDTSWFNPDNEDLTWCFLRYNINGEYINSSGNAANGIVPAWIQIQPVKWFTKLPYWATTAPYLYNIDSGAE